MPFQLDECLIKTYDELFKIHNKNMCNINKKPLRNYIYKAQ